MLKHLLLLIYLFMVLACNRNNKTPVSDVTNDSSVRSIVTTVKMVADESDDTDLPTFNKSLKNLPASLTPFIPAGYSAMDTTYGNLNLDEYPDLVMVLRDDKEGKHSDADRPLLILVGKSNSTYELVARSNTAVYCRGCGGSMGDPFMEVIVKDGYFAIEHYGGGGPSRFGRTTTFKYAPTEKSWNLYEDSWQHWEMNPSNDPDAEALVKVKEELKRQKDFGIIAFQNFDINKEE